MKGTFITFEGIEGSGKSTQMHLLQKWCISQGYEVIATREPGGVPIAETIRELLLDPANSALSAVTELLLYQAARAQHVDELILPALKKGAVVLCDRFVDSTVAYQGAGRSLPPEVVGHLQSIATRGTWPDLTLLIDVPVEKGLARSNTTHTPDRIEQEPHIFHEHVRAGFLCLADQEPDRIRVIDGTRSIEEIANEIAGIVQTFLANR